MGNIKNSQQKKLYSVIGILVIVCFAAISLLNINKVYAQYGGGGGGGDYTAPTISNINVTVSTTTATITWLVNEASISWVVYGTSTAYGLEVKTASYINSNTSHSLVLPNLTSSTIYHYSVKAKDLSGNIGSYTDQTFTTLAGGGVEIPVPPVIEKPISKMTLQELQAELARLIAFLAQLQGTGGQASALSSIPESFKFNTNLQFGQILIDIKYLQIVLNSDSATMVASTGPGSPGNETRYFGPLTKAAVIKFQEKYTSEILAPWGFTTGTGFVGTTTRAKLNAILGR